MSVFEKGLTRSRAIRAAGVSMASGRGAKGFGVGDMVPSGATGFFGDVQQSAENQRRYQLYRGWVHAAIHALAEAAAGQPAQLGRVKDPGRDKRHVYRGRKHVAADRNDEFEAITDHGILDLLHKPNGIQYSWQFVYTFISNLVLTGFGYVVAGENKKGAPELYALPTSWVRPIHEKGPFSAFKIVNPRNPTGEADSEPLTPDQVAFAQLPNPGNPLGAYPPASAQSSAIQIDERIQSSQRNFFDNGIFPSVIVTMGHNPHPDVRKQVRPRLSAKQRRQVYAAIKRVQGGVANYGNPAIVDGLIEKIERISATSNEMGWDASERSVKRRILSAFGIHPFILGEEMVGSEAQARIVTQRFYDKANTFLSLLSTITTDFIPPLYEKAEDGLKIWYEPLEAVNPDSERDKWKTGRSNGDITQEEYRAWMGLPPDPDLMPQVIEKGVVTSVLAIAEKATAGALDVKQAIAMLEGLGIPTKLATTIAGDGASDKEVTNELEEAVRMLGTSLNKAQSLRDSPEFLLAR